MQWNTPIDAELRNLEQKINAQMDERIAEVNQTISELETTTVSAGDQPVYPTFNLGSATTRYNVCCPLTTNFVHPGEKFYVYFEASVSQSDTDINDAEFYAGFYDNTAGQRKYIEGGDFTPTISVQGVPGTRTLEYKIHARTDSGQEILSAAVTTTTAPATLTTDNRVRLDFTGAPGFIQYTVYRKNGANYYRVGDIRNSIDLNFLDTVESGPSVVPVSGYPVVTGARPQAIARTLDFTPAPVGTFRPHTMTIQVPLTYDRSVTGNGMQWFRMGLTGLVASGSEREVVIRRISVSSGYGGWSRSPLDSSAASGPSSTATSAPGGGTPVGDPPGGGGGGPVCLVLDTEVDTPDGIVLLDDIEKGDKVLLNGISRKVKKTQDGVVQFVWRLETEDGKVNKCSEEHRWPTLTKKRTTMFLKVGEYLIDRDDKPVKLVSKTMVFPTDEEKRLYGGIRVKRIWVEKPNMFVANGIKTLNQKPLDDYVV
jgi:hypothetical protein